MKRRNFLKTAGATTLAATGPAIIIPGRAQPKTLKILDVKSVSPPGYDKWLLQFVQKWGERNDTQVILDQLTQDASADQIKTEATEQRGHDLVNPNSVYDATIYDDTMIDLRDVFEECEHRYGKPVDLAIKTTYNPVTGRFYNFAPYYIAYSATYRKDLWDAAEKFPDTWEDLRLGGRKVKFYDGPGLGIGLGDDPDGRRMLGAMLFSFGGSIQDADNRPVLKSRQTLESLKFFKTLYEEAMSDEVLNWNDPIVNNRAMLAEEISWTLNGVSITRSAENLKLPVVDKLALARPPQGPERRLSPGSIYYPLAIWKFADNIEGAKQFLVDLAGSAREVFLASQFFYFPAYPQTIPDIAQLLAEDANAQPPDKYRLLADAADWATYESYPGYANGAFWEVGGSFLLNKMFANTATGKMTPEEALTQADQEIRKIYQKWQDLGKI